MRNFLVLSLAALVLLCVPINSAANTGDPDLLELKLVAQLPKELPQRVMGLAFDGKKLWATIYLGKGSYATLDPQTLQWELYNDKVISNIAGAFASPSGICFADGKLWIAGSYGESFGSVDTNTWSVKQLFKGKQRNDEASQFYSSIAYDGKNLWLVWHWFRYDLPTSQTQLLLKVDPETGKVIDQFPAPAGTPADGTHGLTWDGTKLWHMKDNLLSAIDPATGQVTAQYEVAGPKRPSGLAWVNEALWIAEFEGKIWRLPFRK